MKNDVFRKFRRYDEDGFINSDYDKIHLAIGSTVLVLIVLAFIFLLAGAFLEAMPRDPYYYY